MAPLTVVSITACWCTDITVVQTILLKPLIMNTGTSTATYYIVVDAWCADLSWFIVRRQQTVLF